MSSKPRLMRRARGPAFRTAGNGGKPDDRRASGGARDGTRLRSLHNRHRLCALSRFALGQSLQGIAASENRDIGAVAPHPARFARRPPPARGRYTASVASKPRSPDRAKRNPGTVPWAAFPHFRARSMRAARYQRAAAVLQDEPRPPCPSRMRLSRAGVTGSAVMAPGHPIAASMADAIAAPTPVMPLSPAPLMPSGLSGLS